LRLEIYTNLSEKFKMPLLQQMAKKPLIVDDVISFKVVTDEQLLKKQQRKERYQLQNQEKRRKQRERKVFYHTCPVTTNNSKILLDENFICKRCNNLIPELERIDSKTLDEEWKITHKTLRRRFQKFKKEIDSEPVNAKSIGVELMNLEDVNRVTCYSHNGRIRCCHNKDDKCSCICHKETKS